MQRFLKSSLVWISLLIILNGCYTSRLEKLSQYDFNREERVPDAPFKMPDKALYRATITAYAHELSGLILFKKTEIDGLLVSFFNQIGMQFFDLELLPLPSGKLVMQVHYITPLLDYKKLIATLEKDLNVLFLKPETTYATAKKYFDEEKALIFLKEKNYLGSMLYGFDPARETITESMLLKGIMNHPDVSIHYSGKSMNDAEILILNHRIPVKLQLYFIE